MKVFTTGQVAKICKVAPRTVSKWFDSGRLKGYRIPGSQDRRIPREYLIRFLKEHGMPLGDLEDEAMAKVLIVGQDQVLIENLEARIARRSFFPRGGRRQRFRGRHSGRELPSGFDHRGLLDRPHRSFADLPELASQYRVLGHDPDRPVAGRRQREQLRSFEHQRDVQEAVRRGSLGRTRPHADRRPQGTRLSIRTPDQGQLFAAQASTRRGRPPRRFGNIRGSRTNRLWAKLGFPAPALPPLLDYDSPFFANRLFFGRSRAGFATARRTRRPPAMLYNGDTAPAAAYPSLSVYFPYERTQPFRCARREPDGRRGRKAGHRCAWPVPVARSA